MSVIMERSIEKEYNVDYYSIRRMNRILIM